MRGLLWLIGLFALAAGLAVAGRYNEGYALLVWPPYRIQISLNLLILLLVGAFVAAYSLSRLVARTLALPRAVQQFRARKSRERASQAIYDAVRLRIEGRFGQALKQATAAYEANEHTDDASLMITKHCLRYSFNLCPKEVKGIKPDPMTLISGKEKLTLKFDCKRCEMHVIGRIRKSVLDMPAVPIQFHASRPAQFQAPH